MAQAAVELRNVSKYFAKVIANKDVSITVAPGEVVALLGENGAGKSTIMKILYGLYGMDEGTILVDGREVNIKSPSDAMANGISMIQQHFSLVSTHTATENIILGREKGYIPIKEYDAKIKKIAEDYGFDVPVDIPVGKLAVGQQQKVEILKALYINAKILIMDEPTAVLTPQESDNLMEFIRSYAAKGNSVIFITHKMKEVMAVADRIVVMRTGEVVGTLSKEETNEAELARLMIEDELVSMKNDGSIEYENNKEVLRFENITLKDKNGTLLLDDISFAIKEGEIFGIAGVSGNGQDDICDCLIGLVEQSAGRMYVDDQDISHKTIRERNHMGIGYVPLDRYRDGMVMDMTLAENVLLKESFDSKWQKYGFIKKKELDDYTSNLIKEHRVKATGPMDLAKSLSGGNQQKVVLGREVNIGERLLIFNQPIRGLDMGAVDRIHNVIFDEKKNNKAIMLISTDLSEIFEMCDRIAVMYKGRFMGIYKNGDLTTQQIGLLMAGVREDKEAS